MGTISWDGRKVCVDGVFRKDCWEIKTNDNRINKFSSGNFRKQNDMSNKTWFFPLHGRGNHSAKYCKVIKALESKGWSRNFTKQAGVVANDEEDLNKGNSNYVVHINRVVGNNSFHLKGEIIKREISVLIDTGADVTLISEKLLNKRRGKMRSCHIKLHRQRTSRLNF